MQQNIEFERCIDFLVRMIDKYGDEVLWELEKEKRNKEENVYQFLLHFDKLYDKFNNLEKKEFLNSFVEQVDIYEQEQPDGRFLKHIKFRFPVHFGDRETQELCWDNESTVETVALISIKDGKEPK